MQYNFRYAVLGGEYRHIEGVDSEAYSMAGALSYVGNTFSFSRPITDSFALVQANKLEGVRVTHNGQEIGTTDGSGNLLIPNLTSYYENKVAIDDRDIPIHFTLNRGEKPYGPIIEAARLFPSM